tara:strand:- start:2601 stop:3410 length:810 start_codon:yes stop_codon:yes gene_type:complete
MNKILLVGCGHMGFALLSSWIKKTNFTFTVVDPKNYKKLNLKFRKKVIAYNNLNKINNFKKFDVVVYAIKPQISNIVLKEFRNIQFKKNILFLTVVAGKKISFYRKFLPSNSQIVRVMPNMPVTIELGMSCIYYNKATSKTNRLKAVSLFKNVGKILILNKEEDIDKVTAISGSGPGYFFLFINMLEIAAMKLGFNSKTSRELVTQTALGSILLLIKSGKKSKDLQNNISIKGGTTEAAINYFNKNKIKKIINSALKVAYDRAKELSKN